MSKKIITKKCLLECPRCHGEWAEIKFGPKGEVHARDVKILIGDSKFKDGDALACTVCGYEHTTWDLFIAMGLSHVGIGGIKNNDKDA